MRLTFALIVALVLFFNLLPLEMRPDRWVGPDLVIAFAFAWSLRRPEYVPAPALAILFLLVDLLLFRPPGLWAMLALLACENLKLRARSLRDSSFAAEWITVCVLMVIVAVAYRVLLMVTLVDLPPFGLSLLELVITILAYPLVVAVTHGILGVRKIAPGELDT
ncbi:MAG: rod shape-determining protein MreD [Roseobacter sp.]|nr:rod shape-determining protein MreD [Roseobacter sp.]